jgi:hypothetical protein
MRSVDREPRALRGLVATIARMTEAEGRAVLRTLFEARGFEIAEDVVIEEEGLRVTLDGWDRRRRVGYEYMTVEAGDLLEFSGSAIHVLEERMRAGDLYVFLADQVHEIDRVSLEHAAGEFLDEVARRGVTA